MFYSDCLRKFVDELILLYVFAVADTTAIQDVVQNIEMRKQCQILGNIPDTPPFNGLTCYIEASQFNPACIGMSQSENSLKEQRLSAARRAEYDVAFTLLYLETDWMYCKTTSTGREFVQLKHDDFSCRLS
jgi:hypothetical protein